LLVPFTAPYAASPKQPFFSAVFGSGVWQIIHCTLVLQNKQRPFFACFIYGTLCRIQETAIFPAASWCGVWEITPYKPPL
jgi:hypothetical protein